MGTREASAKNPNCYALWVRGPQFLLDGNLELEPSTPTTVVHKTTVSHEPCNKRVTDLDPLTAASPDLHTLKKRGLIAFKHFLMTKNKRITFFKPTLDATFMDMVLMNVIKYVQINFFGDVVDLLKADIMDAFESFLKSLGNEAKNAEQLRRISELKSLRNFCSCVDDFHLLRVERRLENADLPLETKHSLILPRSHSLTNLIGIKTLSKKGMLNPLYLYKNASTFLDCS